MMSLLQGVAGLPMPYVPRHDDVVTLVLLGCFFLTSYVLARSHKFLLQLVKDFLLHRERTSIFANTTATDMRYLLLLVVQTGVLGGVALFSHVCDTNPIVVTRVPPPVVLALYVGLCWLYIFVKWLLYSFLGWIFFDESRTSLWIESYSTLLYYLGFALFPYVLFAVYFNLTTQVTLIIGLVLFLFIKILMFYKWLKLFCADLYGIFLLILYFCALEIVPCFVVCQGVMELNHYLILKY